jgi:hypothetical protein
MIDIEELGELGEEVVQRGGASGRVLDQGGRETIEDLGYRSALTT